MFKRILSLISTLFAVMVSAVAVGYDYTLYRQDNSGDWVPVAKPYSCVEEVLGTSGGKNVIMTPVFEYSCGFGLKTNATNDGCDYITVKCYRGEYLYVNEQENKMECRLCPRGSWCDAEMAGTDYNINNWQDGIHACPAGITTGATENTGTGAFSETDCSWYTCQPGEQLKISGNVWQDGKCYNESNQLMAGITNRAECVASCELCDEDHYCVGGTYQNANASASMKACPTKITAGAGTSAKGSFRCSYTCPVGFAMDVIGDWYRTDTDCEPCPKGSYCPEQTVYPETTVYNTVNPEENQNVVAGYHGNIQCPEDTTTNGVGAKSVDECQISKTCRAGTYLNTNTGECEQCLAGNNYCPGGEYTSANADENGAVGLYECKQYIVKDSSGEVVYNPNLPETMTNVVYQTSQATADQTACTCPEGYTWKNNTCCYGNEFCCPAGYMVYSFANGNKECRVCQGNWQDTSNPNAVFCGGTVIQLTCTPTEGQYFNGSTCQACVAGSNPNANRDSCVCEQVANEPDNNRYWDRGSNTCKEYSRYARIYHTDIRLNGTYSTHGDSWGYPYWSKEFTYTSFADNDHKFTLATNPSYTPSQSGYEFKGYCKDVEKCDNPITEPIVIDVHEQLTDVKYYAQMQQIGYQCAPGYYLNVDALNCNTSDDCYCKPCDSGYYCPGSTEENPLSVSNIGKKPCAIGYYNPDEGQVDITACKACTEFGDGLTTQSEGTNSADLCGYWCEAGKYAADGTFVCNQNCTAGDYCPGGGPDSWAPGGWRKYFYTKNEPGSGKFSCPNGLTSDAGAKQCYTTECAETEYVKKDSNDYYGCVSCDEDNYKCPGGKITVGIIYNDRYHVGSAGKDACGAGYSSIAPAARCFANYEPGQFVNEFGVPGECLQNSFCPGDASGMQKCPLGSVSEPGATSITDCKCLSDTELADGESAQHRPNGVYAEKGAGLFQVGENEYVCVNTYLAIDNETSYEHPAADGQIPTAGARVVACKWDGTQTDGSYDNCTEKAMRVCNKNTWVDENTGLASNTVKTQSVMNILADAFGTVASNNLFNNTAVASVSPITVVGEECAEISCPMEYSHLDENENYCYALIEYNYGAALPVENPTRYVADSLPIDLNNPELAHHKFNGWCLDGEDAATCLANNIQTTIDPETQEEVTIVKRTIPDGTTGDLSFVAQWQMVCPVDYSHYDVAELTDVTQCYATVTFDANGGTPAPDTYKEFYTENATTYTLAMLPAPTLTGYNLSGWYDNDEFEGDFVTTETLLSGDNTLYAKWTPITYTVAFNANGGENEMASMTYAYDEEKALSANAFERTGYEFAGWCDAWNNEANTCADGARTYFNEEVVSNLTTEDGATITLYAKWTANTYTVAFDANTGVGTMESMTYAYNEEKALSANAFTRTDYEFVDWCDEIDNTTKACTENANHYTNNQVVSNLSAALGAEIVLYATWNPVCNTGKWLHVGGDTNDKLCLYTTKHTTPALVISMDGVTKYYANMCKDAECDKSMNKDSEYKLHIMYNDEIYNVYDLTAQ